MASSNSSGKLERWYFENSVFVIWGRTCSETDSSPLFQYYGEEWQIRSTLDHYGYKRLSICNLSRQNSSTKGTTFLIQFWMFHNIEANMFEKIEQTFDRSIWKYDTINLRHSIQKFILCCRIFCTENEELKTWNPDQIDPKHQKPLKGHKSKKAIAGQKLAMAASSNSSGILKHWYFENSVFVISEETSSQNKIFHYYDEEWLMETALENYSTNICIGIHNLTRKNSFTKGTTFQIQLWILCNNELVVCRESKQTFDRAQWRCDFKQYVNNPTGKTAVCCRIFCTENEELKTNADYHDVSEDLKAAVENVKHSDVLLKLKKVKFPAHKVILSCRSKVFQAMFDNDCKENSENAVDLVDMDVATAKSMLKYIYTGNAGEFTSDNVIKLYSVADRYCLLGLKKQCRQFMIRRMDADNVCEIASAADLHSDEALMEAVQEFFSENLKQIMKSDKCKMLSKCNPTLFFKLVKEAISCNNLTPISKA